MEPHPNVQTMVKNIGVPLTVRAAKIHVLALTPLKEKLGEKWPRLSQLVHKLFESSVARVQGPADGFIALDELSYALVFRNMSLDDTNRVCEAIAKSVCQALFGDQIDEVSVRSVVAAILTPPDLPTLAAGIAIESQLERVGTESIVSQSIHSGAVDPVVTVRRHQLMPLPPVPDTIKAVEDLLSDLGLKAGFLPAWDLTRQASSSVFLMPLISNGDRVGVSGRCLLAGIDAKTVAEVEIALLRAAEAYAQHLFDNRQICAVGTSVSYDTLSGFQSRIRFITALQKVRTLTSNPLMLQIEGIPLGTPAARIGELAAMMGRPNIRITLEFQSLREVPRFEFKLNASILRGDIPNDVDLELASKLMKMLVAEAATHKAFAFVDRLDTPELLKLACRNKVRFGAGRALSDHYFSGLESVPDFPLRLAACGPSEGSQEELSAWGNSA